MYTIGEENVSPFANAPPVLDNSSERDVFLPWQLSYFQMALLAVLLFFLPFFSASCTVLQILVIFKQVFSFSPSVSSHCFPLYLHRCHIWPNLTSCQASLGSVQRLSPLAILSCSAAFLGCLLDKIVKPKQVWIFSLKAEEPGNSRGKMPVTQNTD